MSQDHKRHIVSNPTTRVATPESPSARLLCTCVRVHLGPGVSFPSRIPRVGAPIGGLVSPLGAFALQLQLQLQVRYKIGRGHGRW